MPYHPVTSRSRRLRASGGLLGAVLAGIVLTPPAQADTPGVPGTDDTVEASDPGVAPRTAGESKRIKEALRVARRQLGDPYKYGAEGPRKFDCSGLVYFATHKAGFSDVPRTSSEQADHMRRIKRSKMRRGDFVFFENKGGVYHVGFYVGRDGDDRMIVHAPGTGEDVSRDRIWTDSWFPATLRGA